MSVQPRYPLETAHLVSTLELACRTLADIADRLGDARASATNLLTATDWQTASARRFHSEAETWRHDLDALADTTAYLCDEVGAARVRALTAAWVAGA